MIYLEVFSVSIMKFPLGLCTVIWRKKWRSVAHYFLVVVRNH